MLTMNQSTEEFSSTDEPMQEFELDTSNEASPPFARQEYQVPIKQSPAPLKSCFKRRNSLTSIDTPPKVHQNLSTEEPPARAVAVAPKQNSPPIVIDLFTNSVTAQICGPSRSKCGYCGGSRTHVLTVDDGHNKVMSLRGNGKDRQPNDNDMIVDEESTSKSYGLLFDYLPYETYQKLIDRGWRRSGKHLYRPHNFESCCPAISIRLDTTIFAARSNATRNEMGCDVLVGGSKSQRRVGKNLLKAIESYNAKQTLERTRKIGKDEQLHVAEIKLDSDESTHDASDNVAKPAINASLNDDLTFDSTHRKKKSRRASPGRESMVAESAAQNKTKPDSSVLLRDKQLLSVIEEVEQELLLHLARITYRTITDEVRKQFDPNNIPKWAWWNEDESSELINIPKWCTFKFLPTSKAMCKCEDAATSESCAFIMASTVACAAASGISRGLVGRNKLASSVIAAVNSFLVDRHKPLKLEFHKVDCNEKSGQVQVTFMLPTQRMTDLNMLRPSSGVVSGKKKIPTISTEVEEPFTEYFSRYHSQPHSHQPTGSTSHLKATSRSDQPHLHKLHLVVRTIPVFESSLQPEVHRLYCAYQTATHKDPDPFLCNEVNANVCSDGEYSYHLKEKSVGFLDIDATYGHLVSKFYLACKHVRVSFLLTVYLDVPCNKSPMRRSKLKKSYLSFYRFLCETPLKHEALCSTHTRAHDIETNIENGYDVNISRGGTYHQQYRLCTSKDSFDGPLIAVGVVGKWFSTRTLSRNEWRLTLVTRLFNFAHRSMQTFCQAAFLQFMRSMILLSPQSWSLESTRHCERSNGCVVQNG